MQEHCGCAEIPHHLNVFSTVLEFCVLFNQKKKEKNALHIWLDKVTHKQTSSAIFFENSF